MILEPIKTLHVCVQKVMPLVFDDSLSYLETLSKITDKLNEIIIDYNELIGYYNSLDGLLEQIQQKLSDLDKEVTDFKIQIESEFTRLQEQLQEQINSEISKIETEMQQFQIQLNTQQEKFEEKINKQVTNAIQTMQETINLQLEAIWKQLDANKVEIYNYLDSRLDEFEKMIPEWQNVNVVNPINGKLEPLQKVIDDLYNLMRLEAITAGEYDSLNLTAKDYDKFIINSIPRGLTAFEYDFYGRRYLYKNPLLYMIHPYYSGKVLYKKVVNFNTSLLRESGAFTAGEYDSLLVTASNYDSKQLTANNYDWKGNRMLP